MLWVKSCHGAPVVTLTFSVCFFQRIMIISQAYRLKVSTFSKPFPTPKNVRVLKCSYTKKVLSKRCDKKNLFAQIRLLEMSSGVRMMDVARG